MTKSSQPSGTGWMLARRRERILIVNPFGIGDILFSTPLTRALRRAFPESFIGYLCNRRTERILERNPYIDELFVYEKDELIREWRAGWWRGLASISRILSRLRQGRFTLVVDLSLGERYGFILWCLRVPRRVGFEYRRRGRFLTEALSIDGYHDRHVVEYYRRLLEFIGIRLLDASLELQVSADDQRWAMQWIREHRLDDGRMVVGIVPAGGVSWGAHAPFRRWSFEGFAAVADALVERYRAHVLLFGESTDVAVCKTVARLMRSPPHDLSGQTTLGQFVSLLSRLDLVICNDGGPLHLAVSQGVKTVSIFGPVDPVVYGPYGPAAQHRVVTNPLPCRPCYHQFKLPPCPYNRACLNELSRDDVLEAVEAVLHDAAPGGATVAARG